MNSSSNYVLDDIYVLNVKKYVERRQFMEAQLLKEELQAEFIFDWDIDDLTDDIEAQYFAEGNDLSPAQKSCAMKHIAAHEKVTQNNSAGFVLILEDDAVFAKSFKEGLQQSLNESDQFGDSKVIYIGSGGNFFTPKSQRIPGQHLYIGKRGRFADSYIINQVTAQKRLDWIRDHKISEPIDNQFDKIDRLLDIKIVWLEDPVVEQGSKNGLFDSTIEIPLPTWKQKLFFNFEKLKRKYIYQLWR